MVDDEDGGTVLIEEFFEAGELANAVGVNDNDEVETAEFILKELFFGEVFAEDVGGIIEEEAIPVWQGGEEQNPGFFTERGQCLIQSDAATGGITVNFGVGSDENAG
jgi:hypothetical protein